MEKEFKYWGVRFYTPNHVFDDDKSDHTEQNAIESLNMFLSTAIEKNSKVDWEKITHLSLIVFCRDHHARYLVPVNRLTLQDKVLVCIQKSIDGYEPEDLTERILMFWIESRMNAWHCYRQDAGKRWDHPEINCGTFIELQYFRSS